jgi:amino acid adenylation domain-containing protein
MRSGDIAYVIFTSGSTGLPKGVMVPARGVCSFLNTLGEIYGFRPEDRFSMAHNESFDFSVHDMFSAWNAGASVHVVPTTQRMAPLKYIQERQLTVWGSVPSTAVFLERMNMLQPGAFPSLRYTIFCGEPLPLRSAQAWQRAAPNSSVDNLYGPTECTVFSTWERLSDTPHVTRDRGVVAIGRPLPGFEAAVLDESCAFLAPGVEGELALSGRQLATGYFQDPERTAERFPVIGGKIWYRTGDLVFQDESGIYHHLGRLDNQIKILGHRVELEEIENHLREICGSDMVAAVPWPVDHGSAQGLVAFVSGTACAPPDVKEALRSRVANYMVPGVIRVLEALPLNANGKVDRKELERMLAAAQS